MQTKKSDYNKKNLQKATKISQKRKQQKTLSPEKATKSENRVKKLE